MGSLKSLLGMMPGLKIPAGQQIDDKPMKKFKSILFSMTIKEKLGSEFILKEKITSILLMALVEKESLKEAEQKYPILIKCLNNLKL